MQHSRHTALTLHHVTIEMIILIPLTRVHLFWVRFFLSDFGFCHPCIQKHSFSLHISKPRRNYLQHNAEYVCRPKGQPIAWLQSFLQIVSCEGLHLRGLAIACKQIHWINDKYQQLDTERKSTADNTTPDFYYNRDMILFSNFLKRGL